VLVQSRDRQPVRTISVSNVREALQGLAAGVTSGLRCPWNLFRLKVVCLQLAVFVYFYTGPLTTCEDYVFPAYFSPATRMSWCSVAILVSTLQGSEHSLGVPLALLYVGLMDNADGLLARVTCSTGPFWDHTLDRALRWFYLFYAHRLSGRLSWLLKLVFVKYALDIPMYIPVPRVNLVEANIAICICVMHMQHYCKTKQLYIDAFVVFTALVMLTDPSKDHSTLTDSLTIDFKKMQLYVKQGMRGCPTLASGETPTFYCDPVQLG
jgi:hypothetical protein